MVSLIDSPLLDTLELARARVRRASESVLRVRARLAVIADATDWRSRATERYRAGLGDLEGDLARLRGFLAGADDALASAARRESLRLAQLGGSGP